MPPATPMMLEFRRLAKSRPREGGELQDMPLKKKLNQTLARGSAGSSHAVGKCCRLHEVFVRLVKPRLARQHGTKKYSSHNSASRHKPTSKRRLVFEPGPNLRAEINSFKESDDAG